jgi:hypothetical protein
MTESRPAEAVPKYGALVWLQDPGGARLARFSERLRLHVVAGEVMQRQVFLSGVVTTADMAMQACAFYATDPEYAQQLAYQLALVIAPDFQP